MEQGSLFGTLLPLIVFVGIFYFLLIRPQQKQAKEHKAMVDALAKGDKIVTSGGLKCTVVKTSEDFITVKLNDDVIVELDKLYIARRLDA
ncbi:preprotein translocase subunit YajC [Campylobacter sp. VBCF_06 NA8]|uniref:preprotein translocase subunit YajC n=1 Tax=unclassified Campylobacter TaxID=2593542 RepID=UPI001B6454CD|nr:MULTISPECIES: preprotein translocase subunit YajC [unclassified Campylobacter]MBP3224923.1 preprotein translocase subunit YajC [Campylobacter sp.]MDA3042768.1 preprotein translocase subunit YajC [Campylobacter sp. JMF_09 ED2]MDA3044397.1 preprotein translocase subunit YajC [Campylobacter sp. JMF_07 ED4]MDA3046917.1 preprotein translocase subunit YajC [Campylobacter sp. VBCF_06 NA8]MDA3048426.1 preprotein translocase subunit YajC [Campylobacter sp. JMF_08 NE1]